MDISTVIGIVSGVVLILVAILLGGSLALFIDVTSFLIVIGGTVSTLFIRYPMSVVFQTGSVVKNSFFHSLQAQEEVITQFIELSQISRKEGLLALERVNFEDPFMAKGINYCIDGAETSQIEGILLKEVQFTKARHSAGVSILRAINTTAPAFGMIGTLVGLVNMLAAMDDPKSIGPAMAVALLTTLYGAIVSNLFATPLGDKLEFYSAKEIDLRMLMVEGILALKRGENPRMLEETLHTYLSPKARLSLKGGAS
ncbi:MotA/TolQ/ExbB proton channel family protein [Myxococcota bacterium]|nr:MotA/TolQ/ExbB proton channel family protein [Myxococcota bacterium]MBU1899637.1 MotA/TolQ/ExbB proton channel family protein [Myxococcota bacterium]